MTADLLTDDDLRALAAVLDGDSDRFTALVAAAGLDPACDLKHLNLARIVVQPDEDLAGYDFTGCSLFGAVLRGVDLSATILTDASMAGADLRGAKLRRGALDADQIAGALTGPLPPALRGGKNRLWPDDLAGDIDQAIAEAGDDHDKLFDLARAAQDAARYRLSEHLFQVVLDWVKEELGDSHSLAMTARHDLGLAMLLQGKAAAAEAALRALLPDEERVKGKDHPDTLTTRATIARAMLDQGKAEAAEADLRALIPDMERVKGKDHPDTLTTRATIARAMLDQGKAEAAEADLRSLLPDMQRVMGKDHPHTLTTRWVAAQAALAQGKAPAARGIMPAGPASAAPKDCGRAALLRGWCADLEGDAAAADRDLAEAAAALAPLLPEHYLRRELARYLATRRPGQAGGSTNWMA